MDGDRRFSERPVEMMAKPRSPEEMRYEELTRFIRAQADTYVDLPATLPPARQRIAELGLDVLIYADLGMEGFTYSLAFSRLAPVQCAMWGHPSTSGIWAIDYFISSALAETADAQTNYTEKLVALKNLPLLVLQALKLSL